MTITHFDNNILLPNSEKSKKEKITYSFRKLKNGTSEGEGLRGRHVEEVISWMQDGRDGPHLSKWFQIIPKTPHYPKRINMYVTSSLRNTMLLPSVLLSP